MRKFSYQQGFGAVEAIVFVIVLSLVGFGGWYIWQAQSQPHDAGALPPQANQQQKSTLTFDDKLIPFTFEYPKDWTVKIPDSIKEGRPLPNQYSIELRAPGTVETEQPIGGLFITKGARILVSDTKTTLTDIQDKFLGFYAQAKDRANVTVNGVAAVEYTFAYESDPGVFTDLVINGRDYSLGLYAEGDEKTSAFFNAYKTLVSSFKLK
jgi:hypothetical protein